MASHSNSSIDAGRKLKRRKTRRGTRSCWACKRRKVKCIYASPADDVCIGCARRCLECVGQEFPEQDPGPSPKSRLVGDRIARLESMMQQLAQQVSSRGAPLCSPIVPGITGVPIQESLTTSKHRTLSEALLAAYPSPSDLRIIGSASGDQAVYLLRALVMPSHLIGKGVAFESEKLLGPQRQQYTAETHPVLIARQMLLLAIFLQHLHAAGLTSSSSNSYYQLGELSRPPLVLARRVAEAATTLVTAHDRFTTGTIEGLECLWLETVYYEHNGSLQRSWLACRRAISTLHLLEYRASRCASTRPPKSILEQPDGEAVDLQQIWLRLVHSELALCLALEMPPSICLSDVPINSVTDLVTSEDDDTVTRNLERRHTAIASRFLEWRKRDPDFEDMDTMYQIRGELEEATSASSSEWWRTPSLLEHTRNGLGDGKHPFGTMMKVRAQIQHSHLLVLVYVPSMLQAACGEPATANATKEDRHKQKHTGNGNRSHRFESSRNICVEASRVLLRRFMHLRSCERTAGCFRLLDHCAWLAATTLLLALLLDMRKTTTATSLVGPDQQQRLSDRALAAGAIEIMQLAGDEAADHVDEDMSSRSGAAAESDSEDMLPRLLALEASGEAVIVAYHKPSEAALRSSNANLVGEDQDTLVLPMSFAGLVSITPKIQHGISVNRGGSLFLETSTSASIGLKDDVGLRGSDSDGDGEEEEEDDDHSDDEEAILTRALKLRRRATGQSHLICLGRLG